jgi:hypothetical protein
LLIVAQELVGGDFSARNTLAIEMIRTALKMDHDRSALGLLLIAKELAGADPTTKTTLAMSMIRTGLEIDPDLVNVRWQ